MADNGISFRTTSTDITLGKFNFLEAWAGVPFRGSVICLPYLFFDVPPTSDPSVSAQVPQTEHIDDCSSREAMLQAPVL
jgi:hypothetical protein